MPIGNGGIIGPNNVPSLTSAKGVWSIQEAMLAQRAGTWPLPTPDNVDPYFYSVTSLLHGDGTNGGQNNTFLDSSTNNFTITRNGNTTQGAFSPFSQTGWSNYFDGTGDALGAPANAAFSYGTGDFTYEAWIFPTADGAATTYRFLMGAGGSGQQDQFLINNTGDQTLVYGDGVSGFVTTNKFTLNAWNHVAVSRNSGTLRVFINGVVGASGASTANITIGGSQTFWIGNRSGGADSPQQAFIGYMSNVRVLKGVGLYTSNFTPSLTPLTAISGTSLLTCQANRFLDASSNAFAITRNGDVSVQPFSPFNPTTPYSTSSIGGSGYFDGSGDYLTAASNAAFGFGTGNFTVEAWVYINTATSYANIIAGPSGGATWYMEYSSTRGFYFYDGTNALNGSSSVVTSTWKHLAVSRSGTTLRMFVDGVLTATHTTSSNIPQIAPAIGAYNDGTYLVNGYISNLRVVKGTAVYTAAFTPPTTPLTAITNTSLLTNFTNGAIFDNAAVADYETVGNAQISTSVKKYGTGSMLFDGTGDYLSTPFSQLCRIMGGDFTIEMWVYLNAAQANMGLVSSYSSNNGWLVRLDTSAIVFGYGTGGAATVVSNSASLSTGVWYHIAFCKIGTSLKTYVNGTQVGTTATISGAVDTTATGLQIGRTHTITNDFNGYIDDLRISRYARYPYNFTPPTAEFPNIGGTVTLTADPYFDYTTLLLPGNGTNGAQNNTFIDSSTNNFTITRNGNTTQGTFSPFSQTGWGNYFDGATATRLTMPSNTAFAFGTGAYTVEAWVYLSAHAATQTTVVDCGSATGSLNFSILSTGALSLGVFGVGATLSSAGGAVTLNAWNHVAVVRESTASNATKLYVNGTAVATGTDTGNYSVTTTPAIGGLNSSGFTATGYISNVRLVKGTAVYTSNFTPSTTPLTAISGTSLLTCQSNRFIDNSTNAFAITRNGNVSVQAFSPFNPTAVWSASTNGGSGYFDGSGDFLTAPSNAAFGYGTGDFTIEMWIYPTVISGLTPNIFDQRTANPQVAPTIYINVGQLIYYVNGLNRITGATLVAGQWYHIAVCRASGSTRMFLNGVQTGSTYADANNYINSPVSIFTQGVAGAVYQEGYCGDVRVVKGTALYTTTFTPPTAPLTAITNTSLLLNYTNAGIYDATSKNDLETVGNAQISTTQSKFGGSSMYFDGTGDYLVSNPATSNLYAFGTGDLTIEFWLYLNTTAGDPFFIDFRPTSTQGAYPTLYSSSGTLRYYANTADLITGGTLTTGTWLHIALCRYSGSTRMFINGSQTGSTYADSINYLCPAGRPFIGVDSRATLGALNGYIDDLRITKGIARYTSNFTPPTTAFLTL